LFDCKFDIRIDILCKDLKIYFQASKSWLDIDQPAEMEL